MSELSKSILWTIIVIGFIGIIIVVIPIVVILATSDNTPTYVQTIAAKINPLQHLTTEPVQKESNEELIRKGLYTNFKTNQKEAVEEALRALRKMVSTTEVGVNMQEYRVRVIDMAATVDEALRNIPDSQLKTKILKVKKAYVDAGYLWNAMFTTEFVSTFLKFDGSKLAEYGIDPTLKSLNIYNDLAETRNMNKSLILLPVWKKGKEYLEEVDAILHASR